MGKAAVAYVLVLAIFLVAMVLQSIRAYRKKDYIMLALLAIPMVGIVYYIIQGLILVG